MNDPNPSVFQPEQHGDYTRNDDALASATVAHQEQTLIFGVGHPVDHLIVFGQMLVVVERGIHLAKDGDKPSAALLVVAPRHRVGFSDVKAFLLDHL